MGRKERKERKNMPQLAHERKRERESVCVCEREREREREKKLERCERDRVERCFYIVL